MSNQPSNFRKNDIRRGVLALESAGKRVARVEMQGRKIVLVIDNGATEAEAATASAARSVNFGHNLCVSLPPPLLGSRKSANVSVTIPGKRFT